MPTTRVSDVRPKPSPRLRTTRTNSDPLHLRPVTDPSPKLGERRSPRIGSHSDPVNQKKLGTRIADLELQLGQAQEELKVLKHQLASAEAAKKEAQEKLEKKTKKPSRFDQQQRSGDGLRKSHRKNVSRDEVPGDNQQETDVFEVPMEPAIEPDKTEGIAEKTTGSSTEPPVSEPEKLSLSGLAPKNEEINTLKSKLEEKETELGRLTEENVGLKNQLKEADSNISCAKAKQAEMASELNQMAEELNTSIKNEANLKNKLEVVEGAKESLEAEMKRLRVQTKQWRKAADAAAAVLAGGADTNGQISESCGSMDKPFDGLFEVAPGGYTGLVDSSGMADDSDDGFGSGKRRSSGIKMFGDLWRKKGQK